MTGTLEPAPELGTGAEGSVQASPRAFHTATRLPGGKVLLAGGEVESVEGTMPVGNALVLDVAQRTYTGVTLKAARGHHAAAADASGRVLLVGGVGAGGAVVSEAEGYDPETGRVFSVGTPVPRVGMGVMPVRQGQRIAVVGGSDGKGLRPEVLFFSYQGGTFVPVDEGLRLREPRRDAALVPFGGLVRLLYVGGHDAPDSVESARRLLASSEVIPQGEVAAGPQVFARSGLCAVALPDGRVLTSGGLRATVSGLLSDPHGELLVPGNEGGSPAMFGLPLLERQRHLHTCTPLQDGSVLISGGLNTEGAEGRSWPWAPISSCPCPGTEPDEGPSSRAGGGASDHPRASTQALGAADLSACGSARRRAARWRRLSAASVASASAWAWRRRAGPRRRRAPSRPPRCAGRWRPPRPASARSGRPACPSSSPGP